MSEFVEFVKDKKLKRWKKIKKITDKYFQQYPQKYKTYDLLSGYGLE